MAKQNRGKVLDKLPSSGRGTCPACYTTRTKLLYKRKTEQGVTLSVCKRCIDRPIASIQPLEGGTGPLAYRRKHRIAFNKLVHELKNKGV